MDLRTQWGKGKLGRSERVAWTYIYYFTAIVVENGLEDTGRGKGKL